MKKLYRILLACWHIPEDKHLARASPVSSNGSRSRRQPFAFHFRREGVARESPSETTLAMASAPRPTGPAPGGLTFLRNMARYLLALVCRPTLVVNDSCSCWIVVVIFSFRRRSPPPSPARPHGDAIRFQVGTGCFPTHTSRLLDAPQGPSEVRRRTSARARRVSGRGDRCWVRPRGNSPCGQSPLVRRWFSGNGC
jgi:hypothetical protein